VISIARLDNLSSSLKARTRLLFKNAGKALGLADQRVYYGLVMAFGLLFVLPSLGFINFAYKYHFFADRHIAYYFLSILVFSYLGFFILRTHADRIHSISTELEQLFPSSGPEPEARQASELSQILLSFQQLMDRLEKNNQVLEWRANQLSLLEELTNANSSTLNGEAFLEFGLERACEGTGAKRGWLLMLDESRRHHFTVVCEINTDDGFETRVGMQIPFEQIMGKEAVLKQRPIIFAGDFWLEQSLRIKEKVTEEMKNSLILPLMTGQDVFGVLCLQDKKERTSFSSSDLDFLLPLAAFLSYRLENLNLHKLIATKTEQNSCLSAFNSICNRGLAQGKVFQLLIEEIRNYMPVTVSFLAVYENHKEQLRLVEVASTEPISLRRGMKLPLRQTIFKKVLEENREIHQKDVIGTLHPLESKWFRELGINSCYLAPYRIQGVNVGILFVGNNSKHGFSEPLHLILQQANQYLGLALHNQMLKQQIDEQGRELETASLIRNVVASSLFNPDDALDKIGALLDQMIKVEAGAIYLLENDGLTVKRSFGIRKDKIQPSKVEKMEGICGYVMSRGESVLVRDASQNPHLSSMVTDFGGTQARSVLCVPMVISGEVIGAIHMWNKEYGSFTTHDSKLVNSVAASLATAIVSARLHRQCNNISAGEV